MDGKTALRYADGMLKNGGNKMRQDFVQFVKEMIEYEKENQWHSYDDVKPTEETQYFICNTIGDRKWFDTALWSNDLYTVDDFDFQRYEGKAGFYKYDSEYGYYVVGADYWKRTGMEGLINNNV